MQKDQATSTGTVIEALPNTLFKVVLGGNDTAEKEPILAYLSGRMRLHKIRVMVGDRVELTLDEYGGKARITKRL